MFDTALILTDNEVHARRDKQSVLGFKPRVTKLFAKGSDAFDFLSQNKVDIIFCDSALA